MIAAVQAAGDVGAKDLMGQRNGQAEIGFEVVQSQFLEAVEEMRVSGCNRGPPCIKKENGLQQVDALQGNTAQDISSEEIVDVEHDHPVAGEFFDAVAPECAHPAQVEEVLLVCAFPAADATLRHHGLAAKNDFLIPLCMENEAVVAELPKASFVEGAQVPGVAEKRPPVLGVVDKTGL